MIKLYKPRKDNKGHFFQFNIGKNNNAKAAPYALYIKSVKQYSWSNGTGSFKENGDKQDKCLVVKLNEFEAGAILGGINNLFADYPNRELSLFHSMDNDKTSIKFTGAEKDGRKGVFLNISRNGILFSVPLTLAECAVLAELCRFFLFKIYDFWFLRATTPDRNKPLMEKPVSTPLESNSDDSADDVFEGTPQEEEEADPFDNEAPF